MNELTVNDAEIRSADIVAGNIEELKAIFPEVFTEGKINFEVLRQLLGGAVEEREEKYGLNWHGKRLARQLALAPSTGTLRPSPEDSVDWDTTKNVVIEGDNLEVLKLLQKSYAGRVKLIYIDPPYNTGKDFVYPDDYRDNIRNYLELTGQVAGGRKISTNTEVGGRFHTAWLSMMYPRLMLARTLLRSDGALFVTIDDNEAAHLRQIMDEIFGEENFVANVIWNHTKQSKNDERYFSRHHNQILVFRKGEQLKPFRFERSDDHNRSYANPDNDPRGAWRSGDVRSPHFRATLRFSITTPSGKTIPPPDNGWRWSRSAIDEKIASGEIVFLEDETKIVRKIYLADQLGRIPENLWTAEFAGTTRQATAELKELFDADTPFDTPKPISLVRRFLSLVTSQAAGDVVVDFFAGSGSTGHAVMAQNVSDGGNRRYIIVQLPEPLESDDKEQRTAATICDALNKPRNLAELTKERLRRAASSIKEDNPMAGGDLGFRVFKLDSTNIRAWEPNRADLPGTLENSVSHLKTDRTQDDILYELLLKLGLDLCVPIQRKTIAGKAVESIGGGVLMCCLAERITHAEVEPLAEGIVAWRQSLAPAGETTCVFRDSAFENDVVKTNLAAILNQHGLLNVRSL